MEEGEGRMEEGGREIIKAHPTGYKFLTRSHTAMGEMGEGDRKQTQSVLANWADTSLVALHIVNW